MNQQIETYPIESNPCGRPWREWVKLWWQWCYSGQIQDSPAYDQDGSLCGKNQKYGETWFLAGTFGTRIERKCLIPFGRSIFFPILNDIISFATDTHLKNEKELSAYAKADLDETRFLYVNVDGTELQNLKECRIRTPQFEITIPPEKLGGDPRRTHAVSDGYWIFLKPLLRGNHIIHFIGEKLEYDKAASFNETCSDLPRFRVELIYRLTIE